MYYACESYDKHVMALEAEQEFERTSAFEWLMADADHRAIESPTQVDAVLNLYAARNQFPNFTFSHEQFSWTRLPAAIGRASMVLPLHLWVF